jgi:hypothetical protein
LSSTNHPFTTAPKREEEGNFFIGTRVGVLVLGIEAAVGGTRVGVFVGVCVGGTGVNVDVGGTAVGVRATVGASAINVLATAVALAQAVFVPATSVAIALGVGPGSSISQASSSKNNVKQITSRTNV